MKGKYVLFVLVNCFHPFGLGAEGVEDVIGVLEQTPCLSATVVYAVSLPQSADDVCYDIAFEQVRKDGTDYEYLIDYQYHSPDGLSPGFSAYFDGSHYRFHGQRLQEYHREDSPEQFTGERPVQDNALFTNLLPYAIARTIRKDMAAEGNVIRSDTLGAEIRLRISMIHDDMEVMRTDYLFDRETLLPKTVIADYNIGGIGEQQTVARYSFTNDCPTLTDEVLMERYPDAFGRYRQSNFRFENMVGTTLPQFSLKRIDGERFNNPEDAGGKVMVAVFLDPEVDTARATLEALRRGISESPRSVRLLMFFKGNDVDNIEAIVGQVGADEVVLHGADGLAAKCGVALWPSVMVCDARGEVRRVVSGYNQELEMFVLQSVM